MEFGAVGIPLRHSETALREMMTDSMQPLVQPDFTARFVLPGGCRRIRDRCVSRAIAPMAGADC